ncbi:MAG: phosphatase PAP2-related protein [Candidatus Paceibacterota bacterium]
MKKILDKYRPYLSNKRFIRSAIFSALFLIISLIFNFYAGVYATEKASNSVQDIILSNTHPIDVDGTFTYGPLVLWFFVFFLLLSEPKRIPFTLKTITLFVFIRSVFFSTTHLGPFPDHIDLDYSSFLVWAFTSGGDLFFSGHTGLPFLLSFIFGYNFYLRLFFIVASIFFGIIVLLAHLHYSIDVLSAFFISFAIFKIAETIFIKDWKTFHEGI